MFLGDYRFDLVHEDLSQKINIGRGASNRKTFFILALETWWSKNSKNVLIIVINFDIRTQVLPQLQLRFFSIKVSVEIFKLEKEG